MRKGTKIAIVISSILVVIAALLYFFRVTKITVEGNSFYNQDVVTKEICNDLFDKNTISLWIKNKLGVKEKIPYVREYEVSFPSINTVHIKLYEKSIIAGVEYSNQFIYFDKDGMVLESTATAKEGVPLFEISNLKNFSLYQTMSFQEDGLLERVLNISNLLVHYGITAKEIRFTSEGAADVYCDTIKIELGKHDSYDEAIAAYANILPTITEKGMAGTVDLSNYQVGDNIILKQN